MFKIKNNNPRTPLGLPGLIVIQPGETKLVPTWPAIRDNAIVSAWVRAGQLSVIGGDSSAEESAKAVVSADKEAILAELEALGVKKDKRTSLDKLQAALEKAKAEQQSE